MVQCNFNKSLDVSDQIAVPENIAKEHWEIPLFSAEKHRNNVKTDYQLSVIWVSTFQSITNFGRYSQTRSRSTYITIPRQCLQDGMIAVTISYHQIDDGDQTV